ncbi:opsin, ultraviolet-sensitive-like [Euwallacea fornicatus]|uniref:opsin, ultraviolet-sensitive-like n=1 Tax=Euwallacea fornicatus TaxID=995702 RepID=UPI00338E5887
MNNIASVKEPICNNCSESCKNIKGTHSINLAMSKINPHWLQFPPPQKANFTILGILYTIIMIVGVFGNGIVIFMFLRYKNLRTCANVLIVNLAISDILMMLKMPIFIYNAFHSNPILGDFACDVYGFIGGLSGTASIGTLSIISYNRYEAIRFPLRRISSSKIYICIVLSWANALVFSAAPLLNIGLDQYQYEGYLISCSFAYLSEDPLTKSYIFVFFLAAFALPMIIIGFSYYKIVNIVLNRYKEVFKDVHSIRSVKEEHQRRQELKLALTVLLVIFLWFFSWSPYAVVAFLGVSGQKHLVTPLVSMVPALFCKTASAVDPYFYAMIQPKFKTQLRKLFHVSRRKKKIQKCTDVTKPDQGVEVEILKFELVRRFEILEGKNLSKENFNSGNVEEFKVQGRKFRSEEYRANLLYLGPSFTNKNSEFRKMTKRLPASSRAFQRRDEEEHETPD